MDDARLGNPEENAGVVGNRGSRKSVDREVTQNREMTEKDRLEAFRNALFKDVLPDLPEIPGYHLCWLSTTHSSDSIASRLALGYELLRPEDIPSFKYACMKTAEFGEVVQVKEMIAAKISLGLYRGYMSINHHERPAEAEGKLSMDVKDIKEKAKAHGGSVIEGDGTQELHRSAPSHGVFTD